MENIEIIRSFGILNRAYLNYISDAINSKNISYSESILLVNIGSSSGLSQDELAGLLAIDKAAVARSVKTLSGKNLIRNEHPPDNKRIKNLYLTEAGEILFRFIMDLNKPVDS